MRKLSVKLDKITSIDELPYEESYMYDIGMVQTPHTFFANDILVHNSCFVSAQPLIDPTQPAQPQVEQISADVTEFVNKGIRWLTVQHFRSSNFRLKFMQENLIERGFWLSVKKRYAYKTFTGKVTVKGLDVVRSSFPKVFRSFMRGLINDILDGKQVDELNAKIRNFKREYKNANIFDVMIPSSVKEYSKFEIGQTGTPIHVKSAQNYNMLHKLNNIKDMQPIYDGDKILYAYVGQNPFGFETFALKGLDDDPKELVEFMEKYIDKEAAFNKILMTKIEKIWEDIGWGRPVMQEHDFF